MELGLVFTDGIETGLWLLFSIFSLLAHIDMPWLTLFIEIPLNDRLVLEEKFNIGLGQVKNELVSNDGTRKFLLTFNGNDRHVVETVYIPSVNKKETVGTVCVSSQIGCSLKCSFCHTGTQKLLRNLESSEIIAQIMQSMDFPLKEKKRNVTNIVFMGQGEPLLNFRKVAAAVQFFNSTFKYAPFRTTISTSGVVPLMRAVGNELGASLAVSLHAVNDQLRDELVPLNKQYNIQQVLDGCQQYIDGIKDRYSAQKRITFEYVMLEGINDGLSDARELKRLLSRLPSHVNLIPFNPWPGSNYKSSSMKTILEFQKVIKNSGIPSHIRLSRGQDIYAACGQLASSFERKKRLL